MHLYFQLIFELVPHIFELSEALHVFQSAQSCAQSLRCSA